ncbi:similar to Saccharomyces cerevisiae YMR069W NAT4 N alpha-acetyl-transferase, involved in acetylation of the N-terminal residues of histones H4 and H2A [Maudiozyma saulgeensis]|uniref:N-alpha-acetyltransferase 40 n=1 Tax=Maudiozyma saulgeensis TaxID=1789683 RepID=A0A1X7R844_9SACH|nr:similar to Saccharomyces cerevisiae YMR069W NAT4 N alpha-acetyl-transferase, involved in acetylation of the N-terminal residues of histones H4 and H2A [Kazachstania saulgeensis]
MNESEVFNDFLQITLNNFPLTIPITINNEIKYLERDVLYMKPVDSPSINQCDEIKNIIQYDETNLIHQEKLLQLLTILDINLGEKYSKISKLIYENDKPWKINKLNEMKSSGLIYIIYKLNDEPYLFMSFMLTNEDEFDGKEISVIYLYEIQLLSIIRKQGIGSKLINENLLNCSKEIYLVNNKSFIGIELTVFSDNYNAINFYKSIGMKLTPWSPQDTIKKISKRITRSNNKTKNVKDTQKIVIKPIYYLYYLPIN